MDDDSGQGKQARRVQVVRPTAFYDARALKRARAGVEAAQQTSTTSSTPARPRFDPARAPWRQFATQAAAFAFLDAQPCAPVLRTFAVETTASGQRQFIVTSAARFWDAYKALPPGQRHHYEIIREGQPCHLFLDLEFATATNAALDGSALVARLLAGVGAQLAREFDLPWQTAWAIELDSSTPAKFSRHVIVRVPGCAFADACEAGRFARLVVLRLLAAGAHCSGLAQLLVAGKEQGGPLSCFVDLGVFTRNRAFRLLLSSKFGKAAALKLTHRFGGAERCPASAFADCLVSVLPNEASSRSGCYAGGRRRVSLLRLAPEAVDWAAELRALPAAWQAVPMLQLQPSPHGPAGQARQPPAAAWAGSHTGAALAGAAGAPAGGTFGRPSFGPSPVPALDAFIVAVCCQGGVQGQIRSWMLQPSACTGSCSQASGGGCTMLFSMKGNRWCGNVERQHRSNGIYYVVDLAAGTFHQRCWDPECRGYRSEQRPLPGEVWRACGSALGEAWAQAQAQQQQRQQQQGQQQQGQAQQADEDEACLALLQQLEQQLQPAAHMPRRAPAEAASCCSTDEDAACVALLRELEARAARVA